MTAARRPTGPVIVGLDVGTTGVKAVTFDVASPWRRVAVREYPLLQPAPGWQVQDPDAMLAAATSALADCVAAGAGTHVVAIAASSAMHSLLALDRDLRPLTPLVTWADGRAGEEARSLRSSGQAARLHRLTGTPVHPMTPLTKLLWFRRHEPQIWASARWWVGLKDYLLYRLRPSKASAGSWRSSSTVSAASSPSPRCGPPVARSGRRCGATSWRPR